MQFDRFNRREFTTLLGGAAASWPLAARAQQSERVRRIGVLMHVASDNSEGNARVAVLREALREFGWIEGRNIQMVDRWGAGDIQRVEAYAGELVALDPDVIFVYANAQLAAIWRKTRTIPIVFVGASDPVGAGYVASFARPGANITGFTLYEGTLGGKWLGILKEIVPTTTRVAIMTNPETATLRGRLYASSLDSAATAMMVQLVTADVRSDSDIEAAITALARKSDSTLIVAPDTFTDARIELITSLAARHRLPAIYGHRHFPMRGGLISYGPDTTDAVRRAATYVNRILRGEHPAELPIQAPTKFEFVINLKTAKALGIEVPPMLLARADEVIE